jgi:hypothetical protein
LRKSGSKNSFGFFWISKLVPQARPGAAGGRGVRRVVAFAAQNNEKHNRGDWESMGRATDCSGALYLGLQGFDLSSLGKRLGLCRVPRVPGSGHNKDLASNGAEENLRRAFMRRAGVITRYLKRGREHHFVPFGLICVKRPDPPGDTATGRDLPRRNTVREAS